MNAPCRPMEEVPVANKRSNRVCTNGRGALVALLLSALSLGAASHAHAAGRFCISADTLLFGNRTVGTNTNMSATVTNCGDAAWSFTDVSVDPVTGAGFHLSTTCSSGLSLAPGSKFTIDVLFAPLSSGHMAQEHDKHADPAAYLLWPRRRSASGDRNAKLRSSNR